MLWFCVPLVRCGSTFMLARCDAPCRKTAAPSQPLTVGHWPFKCRVLTLHWWSAAARSFTRSKRYYSPPCTDVRQSSMLRSAPSTFGCLRAWNVALVILSGLIFCHPRVIWPASGQILTDIPPQLSVQVQGGMFRGMESVTLK